MSIRSIPSYVFDEAPADRQNSHQHSPSFVQKPGADEHRENRREAGLHKKTYLRTLCDTEPSTYETCITDENGRMRHISSFEQEPVAVNITIDLTDEKTIQTLRNYLNTLQTQHEELQKNIDSDKNYISRQMKKLEKVRNIVSAILQNVSVSKQTLTLYPAKKIRVHGNINWQVNNLYSPFSPYPVISAGNAPIPLEPDIFFPCSTIGKHIGGSPYKYTLGAQKKASEPDMEARRKRMESVAEEKIHDFFDKIPYTQETHHGIASILNT